MRIPFVTELPNLMYPVPHVGEGRVACQPRLQYQ